MKWNIKAIVWEAGATQLNATAEEKMQIKKRRKQDQCSKVGCTAESQIVHTPTGTEFCWTHWDECRGEVNG